MKPTYRMVAGTEIAPLLKEMESRGIPLPNTKLPVIAWIEETGEKITDMCVLQLVPIVEIDGRTGQSIAQLFKMAAEFLKETQPQRVLMHTKHRTMKRMLELAGAECSPDTWFVWKSDNEVDKGIAKANGDTDVLHEMGGASSGA